MLIKSKRSEEIAAKLNTKSYKKLESLVEDIILIEKMKENKKENRLELNEAISFYHRLVPSTQY